MMRLFCRLELQPRHKPKHKRSTNEACVLTRDAKEQSQHRACHCSLQVTGCRIDLPPSTCLLVWSLSLYSYLCKVRMGIGVMRWLPDGYHCSNLSFVSPGRHTGPEISGHMWSRDFCKRSADISHVSRGGGRCGGYWDMSKCLFTLDRVSKAKETTGGMFGSPTGVWVRSYV